MSTWDYRVFGIHWFTKDSRLWADLPTEAIVPLSSHLVLGEGIRDADWIREIKVEIEQLVGVRPKSFGFAAANWTERGGA